MIDIALKSIISILFLMLLGIGPALLIYKRSLDLAVAVAPTIGLMFTTLIGSGLILVDLPILTWAYAWLIIGCLFSLSLAAYGLKKYSYDLDITYLLLGGTLVTFMLLLPMMYGGLSFTVLRGNATDAFNYISLAGYLQHEPYSWGQLADTDMLMNKHPSYVLARELLPTRWSTSMLLGWFGSVIKTPVQQFEYAFTLIFFILSYGCSYTLCKQAGLKKLTIMLISLALCIGFWAQFVLDIRAMSHITVLPLLILLIPLMESMEKDRAHLSMSLLLGLLITSIALLYIEILPFLVLGMVLFFMAEIGQKRQTLAQLFKKYSLAVVVSVITLYFTSNHFLMNFFMHQLNYANSIKNTWHEAYFSWLYTHPLLGFWGLLPLHSGIIKTLFTLLAIFLTCLFIYLILDTFLKKETSSIQRILAALVLASLIEAMYLKLNGQYWATGKALSYGYPYVIFFIAVGTIISQQRSPALLKSIGKYFILVFLIIQCSFGLVRIARSNQPTIYYAQPMTSPPDYHHHDFTMRPFQNALKPLHGKSIGFLISNEFMKKYVENVLGFDVKLIDLSAMQHPFDFPTYMILPMQNISLRHYAILAKNSELMLIKLNSNFSIEQLPLPHFTYSDNWLKLNQTIRLQTAFIKKMPAATLTLKGKLLPQYFKGPVDIKLHINGRYIQHKIIYPGEFEWNIPMDRLAKTNDVLEFLFTSNKILAINSDSRSLTVLIDSVKIAKK